MQCLHVENPETPDRKQYLGHILTLSLVGYYALTKIIPYKPHFWPKINGFFHKNRQTIAQNRPILK